MITADKLAFLTTMGRHGLARTLADSGYTGASFESAKFLGITNSGQFCYGVTFFDEAGTGEVETGKVFLTYNPTTDKVIADY